MADTFARQLRKNLTDAERRLWSRLRVEQIAGCKFRRQAPIGRFIVDFVCYQENLIVELDGGQHAIRTREDDERTAWLNSQGFQVVRFWNNLIFEDLDAVLESIALVLRPTPHPNPPPQGGRGPEGGESQTSILSEVARP
jgi:very-short-patch-repair endonuclease